MIRFKVRLEGTLIRLQISIDRLTTVHALDIREHGQCLFDQRRSDILQRCSELINSRRFHLSKEPWLELD